MALKRLDILLCERGLCKSREEAQARILSGEIWSNNQRLEKPGQKYEDTALLELRSRTRSFSSRAGHKLEHALMKFNIPVSSRICLDIGASHGGFTDCLLERGARHVFAVDVGYGQLDARLRGDPRVTPLERCNARYLHLTDLKAANALASNIDLIVIDVSFISLEKIVIPLSHELPFVFDWIFLFKPQFEVGRRFIGKGGIVKDEAAVRSALEEFTMVISRVGLTLKDGPEPSPLAGKKSGNLEYLLAVEKQRMPGEKQWMPLGEKGYV